LNTLLSVGISEGLSSERDKPRRVSSNKLDNPFKEETMGKRKSNLFLLLIVVTLSVTALTAHAQAVEREQLDREIDALWEQIKAKQELLLALAPEDKAAYTDFLKQPDTGLIRLLPRDKYDYAHKLPMRGGGSYYSFVLKTHEYGRGSDICLEQGSFSVGFAGADYGFLYSLGDKPLAEINLETPVVKAMLDYVPPTVEKEVRAAARQADPGIVLGSFTVKSRLPAEAERTYLLRSISIDDSDVLIAFRVTRKDADGSLILLWKKIMAFPVPKMIRDNS
jgi:hypothetical protein